MVLDTSINLVIRLSKNLIGVALLYIVCNHTFLQYHIDRYLDSSFRDITRMVLIGNLVILLIAILGTLWIVFINWLGRFL